ncbi:MAG: hypothetical protein EA001_16425 [Oscillatoriales cyanobacterium]|nr:MAG: hypothetical protein EA001_16425 [Oscillatoriales cyanobacterium]
MGALAFAWLAIAPQPPRSATIARVSLPASLPAPIELRLCWASGSPCSSLTEPARRQGDRSVFEFS